MKCTIRLAVKFLQLIPKMLKSFEEGFQYPDLFLVDENVAIAMSYYEILLLLQNVFGQTARALKFIIKCD